MTPKSSKNNLFNILNSLNISQQRDLEKFLTMSSLGLTNADRGIFQKIMLVLKKNKKLDEGKFWNEVLSISDTKNKNRIKSRLFKAIEGYLCLLELQQDVGIKTLLLASYYFRKNLMYNLTKSLNKGIKSLSSLNITNLDHKIILFWLHEKYVLITKDVRKENVHINCMEEELSEFYILSKMKIICEKANRLNILNSENELQKHLQEIIELKNKFESPFTRIYYHLFLLIGMDESSSFRILKDEIHINGQHLNPVILKEIYIYSMNFCIKKINKGKFEYAEPFFNYVKIIDSNDMILDHNILSIGRFKNTMVICYILDEIDWATYFISKYSDFLKESKTILRKDFLSLNLAIIALWRKDYNTCMDHIRNFQTSPMYHKDVYYKITCDKLLLKAFFEMNETEAFNNKINILIGYIRNRKKLSTNRKEPNVKFLNLLDKINNKKPFDIKKLKGKIPIADYVWLERTIKKG